MWTEADQKLLRKVEHYFNIEPTHVSKPTQPTQPTQPAECECSEFILVNSYKTCVNCGATDLDSSEYVFEYFEPSRFCKRKSLYKRRQYFVEKLELIACRKRCHKLGYRKVLDMLKNVEFDSIFTLRKKMKRLKLNKWYPYMYLLYYELTGIKLINISAGQVNTLTKQFLEIEFKYKDNENYKRYISGYNTIICFLLKNNNIEGYEHIILPKKTGQYKDIFDEIFQ